MPPPVCRPTPERLEPLALAVGIGPLHQLQAAAAGADQAGIEQLPGLDLAGRGAAMLDDDVERVAGADPRRHLHLRVERADIGLDRARRHAGGARRAVEAGADPALDAQRRLVDRGSESGSARAGRRAHDLDAQVEAGAEGEPLERPRHGRLRPPARGGCRRWCPGLSLGGDAGEQGGDMVGLAPPTPARCRIEATPSPRPRVARRSTIGRSGLWLSGSTASVGAIRRPVSAP